MKLDEAAKKIQEFEEGSLTTRLATIETLFNGQGKIESDRFCRENGLDSNLLEAAFDLKKLAGQINVVIHSVGILATLPSILDSNERVESLSLGAGNTGKKFDQETNLRIAEFKFINWRGGPESIRQNSLFKDFYYLAEEDTHKKKFLYVLDKEKPLRFFNGSRALTSVMSKNSTLANDFKRRHGPRFRVVVDYYRYRQPSVEIVDVSPYLRCTEI